MSRRSIYANIRVRPTIPILTRTGNATTAGTAVPLNYNSQQFRMAFLLLVTGAVVDGSHTVSVEESANGSTGWTAVPSDRLEGTIATITGTNDDAIYEQGIIPDPLKPFLRCVVVQTAATTGATFGAWIILSSSNYTPVERA
jgi:hypothetical protein